jgi:hypothetical protein
MIARGGGTGEVVPPTAVGAQQRGARAGCLGQNDPNNGQKRSIFGPVLGIFFVRPLRFKLHLKLIMSVLQKHPFSGYSNDPFICLS